MSGAMRFAFQRGGPLTFGGSAESYRVPALSLLDSLRDPRVLAFLVVWFGLNLLFGLGSVSITGNEQPVAWQAHVGGFLAGLLLFSWFDPVGSSPQRDDRGRRLMHCSMLGAGQCVCVVEHSSHRTG